jgi:hypothetical protein
MSEGRMRAGALVFAMATGAMMSCNTTGGSAEHDGRGPTEAGSACRAPSAGVRRLDSYAAVEIPGRYWVEMVFDGREWAPADPLPMPRHHATRLELTNVGEISALTAPRAERLRFTIEITSREIRQVADREQWRATYFARVLEVCAPSAP